MLTKFAPIKKCIYSRASVNYDRQTIFAIIDRLLYRTPILKFVTKKNPSKGLAAGASSRTGKWTDIISSSAVVYYVIKDAYKAVRHQEQDNEVLTHSSAIFHTLSRQYYINLLHKVTATQSTNHITAMCHSLSCIWFISALRDSNLRITPVSFERRTDHVTVMLLHFTVQDVTNTNGPATMTAGLLFNP